jgi:hypothetical protein
VTADPAPDDLTSLLWPAPAVVRPANRPTPGGQRDVARYLAVPGRDEPRLLLPLRPRRAAALGLRQTGRRSGRLGRWARAAAAGALSVGAGDLMRARTLVVSAPSGHATVERTFAEALGQPVALVVSLGRPRANRKPVVQVVDRAARTLAYAKVAVDPLTRALVDAETATLARLATHPTVVVRAPRVLLRDGAALVQEALPQGRRPVDADLPLVRLAEDEVAALDGVPVADRLAGAYGQGLRARVEALPAGPGRDEVVRLVGQLLDVAGTVPVRLGPWHGDWTPWNLGIDGTRVNAWDWERFGGPVPTGFDRFHYELQRDLVVDLADPQASVRRLLDDAAAGAPRLRHPDHAADATPLATAYLLELATRYLADGQAEAGARLGAVETWLLPPVADRLATRTATTTRGTR